MLGYYWNTIRYLKFRQIYHRIFRFLKRRAKVKVNPLPTRLALGIWSTPAKRKGSMLDSKIFVFLNHLGNLEDIGWQGSGCNKLWTYNLHYFDDLNAKGAFYRYSWHKKLMQSWVVENTEILGVGWEPYPLSLRIVNWIKWQLNGNSLGDFERCSLAIQARVLAKSIEFHLLGNHLFANAKALVFAGVFFNGIEADIWRDLGLKIISEELSEQVLNDGGNFELSPMYHAIFLEDLLDLINLSQQYPNLIDQKIVKQLQLTSKKMLRWLTYMSHPDGEISQFNDSSLGVAPSPHELFGYADRLNIKCLTKEKFRSAESLLAEHFEESGYIAIQGKNIFGIIDVGQIGPDYLPAHAHADTLTFELSLFHKRVFVNSGTSTYENGKIRHKERSTAAHNTVVLDSENSSEVWGSFRVARRAYTSGLEIDRKPEEIKVKCKHGGYRRLKGSPEHFRVWQFFQDKLQIIDHVSGDPSSAIAFFHLHPDVSVLKRSGETLRLSFENKFLEVSFFGGKLEIENTFHALEFGKRRVNKSISVNFSDTRNLTTLITWGSVNEQ